MNEMTTLQSIERRITYHIQGAYANVLEVGRCLIEAKESGLVAHGQWEAWVQRVAGMSGRTAQRLMQAAREVSPDSAMAKLPISKIQTILALPEPEREAVAEKAVAENQSLRELQATVDAMRGEIVAAREMVQRVERERDNAIAVLDKTQKRRAEFEHECNELRRRMQGVKAPATGISAEAQAEIDRLNAALSDAEQMAEYQAKQREEAQRELLDLKSQQARGEARREDDLTAEAVAMAVRTLIGAVGYLPHSAKLAGLSDADRQLVLSYAGMLERWVDEVRNALSSDPVLIGEV